VLGSWAPGCAETADIDEAARYPFQSPSRAGHAVTCRLVRNLMPAGPDSESPKLSGVAPGPRDAVVGNCVPPTLSPRGAGLDPGDCPGTMVQGVSVVDRGFYGGHEGGRINLK